MEKTVFPVAKRVWALTMEKCKVNLFDDEDVGLENVTVWLEAFPQKNPESLPVHWGIELLSKKKPFDPVSKKAE